jgi:hypothetical protein
MVTVTITDVTNTRIADPKSKLYQRAKIEAYLQTVESDAPIRLAIDGPVAQSSLAAFEKADALALAFQQRYRRVGRLALWAATIGTLVGAFLLLPLDRWIDALSRGVIGGIQTMTLIVTFLAIQWIGWRKPIDQWMTHRAAAERQRGTVFEVIVTAIGPAGTDGKSLSMQKLDCLMTAHVEDQLRYFDKSCIKHKMAAGRATPLRLVGYVLVGIAMVFGAAALVQFLVTLGWPVPDWLTQAANAIAITDANRWQLGLGTIASSLLAHTNARTMMDQDERNAALYAATARKVREYVRDELEGVRVKAKAGENEAIVTFFRGVRRILEAEHLAWFLSRPPRNLVATAQGGACEP